MNKQHKVVFEPEKLKILDIKVKSAYFDEPPHFDKNKIINFQTGHGTRLAHNSEEEIALFLYTLKIETGSSEDSLTDEAECRFEIVLTFSYSGMKDFEEEHEGEKRLSFPLVFNLASVSYSTIRGVLFEKLLDTPFRQFILPVINPKDLFNKPVPEKALQDSAKDTK